MPAVLDCFGDVFGDGGFVDCFGAGFGDGGGFAGFRRCGISYIML